MAFMPYSPRWLMEKGREEQALQTLSALRRKPVDDPAVHYEFLEIKAEIQYSREIVDIAHPNASRFRRLINNYITLVATRPKFKRLAVGCLTMFYQQFMVQSFDYPQSQDLTVCLLGYQCENGVACG